MNRSERRHRAARARARKSAIVAAHEAWRPPSDRRGDITEREFAWVGRGPRHSKARRVGRIVGVAVLPRHRAIAEQI